MIESTNNLICSNMKKYIVIAVAFLSSLSAFAQQKIKYDDIYYRLPDLSLSNAYSLLLNYQAQNPYFANTYLQLGLICEQKMVLSDPLRDFETAQFWANDAKLFLNNLNVFYTDNDVRSNSEYYANIDIPKAGNKVTDAELKSFVDKHKLRCNNYIDSTTMIYNALTSSKIHYNNCIQTFKQICNNYETLNDVLLRNDDKLVKTLKYLSNEMDSCVLQFDEYKRLLKGYHIGNYRQKYDFKTIETFRLDGLTNSDFYENQFYVWNYKKWIDDYNNMFTNDILPLRNKIAAMQQQFDTGKNEFLSGNELNVASKPVFDDLFIFQLGKYDNNSLVRDLFKYLDERRELFVLSGNALNSATDSLPRVLNQKMRYYYRLSQQHIEAKQNLDVVSTSVTSDKIARFGQFFWKYYGGQTGMTTFAQKESAFLNEVMRKNLDNFSLSLSNIERVQQQPVYSAPSKGISVPLWIVGDSEQSKVPYSTSNICYDVKGFAAYISGNKKNAKKTPFIAKLTPEGSVAWLIDVKNVANVSKLQSLDNGCIAIADNNGQQYLISYDLKGKEIQRNTLTNTNKPTYLNFNEISGNTIMAFTDGIGNNNVCLADSAFNIKWEVALQPNGAIADVIVQNDKALAFINASDGSIVLNCIHNGSLESSATILEATYGMNIKKVFSASKECISLFVQNKDGKLDMINVEVNGNVVYSTVIR